MYLLLAGLSCVCDSGYRAVSYKGGPDLVCQACPGGTCPPEPSPGPCTELSGGVCFDSTCPLTPITTDLFTIPLENCPSEKVESNYFREHLRAAHGMCNCHSNYTACQMLGNMCTLLSFSMGGPCVASSTACKLYRGIIEERRDGDWPPSLPMLYYLDTGPDDVISDNLMTTKFTFVQSSENSKLRFRVAQYALNGEFLGLTDVLSGVMQLCAGTDKRLDAAFTFGTYYTQSCELTASKLWDTNKFRLVFLDPYIEYEENGETRLFAIPISVSNYVDASGRNANSEDVNRWQLTRRFYMVDNQGTIPVQTSSTPGSTVDPDQGKAQYVRYARSIRIRISLRYQAEGQITPPVMYITYGQVSLSDANNGDKIPVSFTVEYTMFETEQLRNFQIAVGVLSTLAFLHAAFRTWVWSKRAGRIAIDFLSLINFVFLVAGSLANIFFVVIFGTAFYYLVFFKRQDAVHLVHPQGQIWTDFQGLLCSAFILKTLHVVYLLFMQCTADIFLIDWERPRAHITGDTDKKKSSQVPVSIWRTYFVANEWNELQAVRKINKVFQVVAVVFFLEVVGFVNVSTKQPDGAVTVSSEDYRAEQSPIYRFATLALIYLLVALVQWIFFTFIYERFIEDKVRQFVDLCSMSNISVFIMAHAQYGFYIHGRSVHGKADTDMRDMHEMLKREEDDLCGKRGLLPNTEQQTFEMLLPPRLRYKYNQVYLPLALEKDMQTPAGKAERGQGGSRIAGTHTEKLIQAYATVNKFLSAFIDHSLRDVDYIIKDKTLIEGILDTEFLDPLEKGLLYNDNGHSFDRVLFYGHEMTLCVFELLLFAVVDLVAMDYVLSGVITYIISEVVMMIRSGGGRSNVAKKTLVDERFLI
ncbi:meckelin-like [Liolophura sinensis]|uniref:meckelin-like n=1 Tax=Liolophura sinensis TaxID=3198878 RepID=UPI0031580552